jgi:DNA polymerase IV
MLIALKIFHQRKFSMRTDCTMDIFEAACRLFDEAWNGQPIRHLGVRVSELQINDFLQLSLPVIGCSFIDFKA